jgi:tetratricopeptide (TPR) repeat protein
MLLYLFALLAAPQAEPMGCPIKDSVKDAAWRTQCDKALKKAKDPKVRSVLLFRSAYGYNETGDAAAARAALEEAVKLDPANAAAWQELSYTANALDDFAAGERAADAKIALGRRDTAVFQERAYARFHRGNLLGAFQDRDILMNAQPRDAGALIEHAQAALWFGRDDLARIDLQSAGLVATSQSERAAAELLGKRLQHWTARSKGDDYAAKCLAADKGGYKQPLTVGECSAAFLAEKDPVKRANYLMIRSVAWLTEAQDQQSSLNDRIVAAALDPGNPDWQGNLGFAYGNLGNFAAAARAFDRSLAMRETWTALAGRASVRYELRDKAGALADARRSFELHANELALIVLGDLARDEGDSAKARMMWLGAWRLGSHGDDVTGRLKSVGVTDPDKEPVEAGK